MHRIDSSTATPDNRFTEGNPTIPVPATTVTADWLNSVQEEAVAVIEAAGIAPDKANNAQVLAAIRKLIADKTIIDGVTIRRRADGTLYADPYLLGEFYTFRHPSLRRGFAPANGGLFTNAAIIYPEIWAYLQTSEGQQLCKSEVQWQDLSKKAYYTLPNGKVGFGGIGGVPWYVQDLAAGTLRMPDLRGLYAEIAGFDSLEPGGVHIDCIRNITSYVNFETRVAGADGAIRPAGYGSYWEGGTQLGGAYTDGFELNAGLQVPVGVAIKPRGYGALGCCYLGQPSA